MYRRILSSYLINSGLTRWFSRQIKAARLFDVHPSPSSSYRVHQSCLLPSRIKSITHHSLLSVREALTDVPNILYTKTYSEFIEVSLRQYIVSQVDQIDLILLVLSCCIMIPAVSTTKYSLSLSLSLITTNPRSTSACYYRVSYSSDYALDYS